MSNTSTQGIELRSGSDRWRRAVELLSSMRFAIALLTVICIASVIGTVLKQHEPNANYVNQFGPFWADVFLALKLNAVYSAWWFLLILAFLVVSTSLCIVRNTPKIFNDLRSYKENIREQSLRAFHHKAEAALSGQAADLAAGMGRALAGAGWKVRLQERQTAHGLGWMLAAKSGAANKLGYLAAHGAIVLICLGGLFDGDLVVRAQTWFGGKSVYQGGGLISEVKPEHRLSASNPTFRGNLVVAEGTAADTAVLSQSDGILLQELPFAVELKKFIVEYYDTGMPKLFASEVLIHDKATGAVQPARIEVNHPASYKGIEIYQSSFDDGGSRVKLHAVPLVHGGRSFDVEGHIGNQTELSNGQEKLALEYSGLRVINVENFAGNTRGGSEVDVRKVDLRQTLASRMGAGHKTEAARTLRNVGPSVSYKLRDAAGQAREYNNYMLPVDLGDGGPRMFLFGVRDTPASEFSYLRIPADEDGSLAAFTRLRDALADPALRARAVARDVDEAVSAARGETVREQLRLSATRLLALFAGAEAPPPASAAAAPAGGRGGLQAVASFLEASVPEDKREEAGAVMVRILNGTLAELDAAAREAAGAKPLPRTNETAAMMQGMVMALSDVQFYPTPFVLTLQDFTQVQASVFQVARAPGKLVVYLGCALLILGVFAMLYVRERRLWIWLAPTEGGAGSQATMALSSNRQTLDTDREFDQLRHKLLGLSAAKPQEGTP